MALPERVTNSPTPGTREAVSTLKAELKNEAGPKVQLEGPLIGNLKNATGQCRLIIDNEIVLVECSTSNPAVLTVLERGAEGSTKAAHAKGASVFHVLTAAALENLLTPEIPTEKPARAEKPTAFEPSPSKHCLVTVSIQNQAGVRSGAIIYVNKVSVINVVLPNEGAEIWGTASFIVPAGKTWEWEKAVNAPTTVVSSYFFFN